MKRDVESESTRALKGCGITARFVMLLKYKDFKALSGKTGSAA